MPMVARSGWTGYFTEIANLVPACGKCNQSRGSKPVESWMRSLSPWSPRLVLQARGMSEPEAMAEIERRIAMIDAAVAAQPPMRLDLIDDELEVELERCRVELNELLFRAEAVATGLRSRYAAIAADALSALRQIG